MPQPSYCVGIDLGTTYSAAAVCRDGEPKPDTLPLGEFTTAVASMVYLAPDGSMVCGEAAHRRAITDPRRVVREFKRRIGDGTPIVVGGTPVAAEEVAARFVAWVLDRVAQREGGPATRVALTHPAEWGRHKRESVVAALRALGIADVLLLSEPEAAAVGYASTERVDAGGTVAVYDLGGGTFDAAVVRKLPDGGFELAGKPVGIERLGGIDFDEIVFDHVRAVIGDAWQQLDPADPAVRSAVAGLRRECTAAKEALSADTEVVIPVMVPGHHTQVRLGRAEFEEQIRPAVAETVEALRRALDAAGTGPADLGAVLMVGGSSRIPLVTQLVSAELGRPVTADADPKSVIAAGAAIAARGLLATRPVAAGPAAARRGAAGPRATGQPMPQPPMTQPPMPQPPMPQPSMPQPPMPQPPMTLTKPAAPRPSAPTGAGAQATPFTAAGNRLAGSRAATLVAGLGLAASIVAGLTVIVLSGGDAGAEPPPPVADVLASADLGGPTIEAAPSVVDEWTGEAPVETTISGPRRPVVLAAKVRPRGRIGPVAAPVPTAAPVPPPATDVTTPARTSRSTPPAPTSATSRTTTTSPRVSTTTTSPTSSTSTTSSTTTEPTTSEPTTSEPTTSEPIPEPVPLSEVSL